MQMNCMSAIKFSSRVPLNETSQKYLVHFCQEKNDIKRKSLNVHFHCLKKENRRHAVQLLLLGIHLGKISFKLCKIPALVTLQCRVCFDLRHVIVTMIHAILMVMMLNLVRIFNQSLVCYDISSYFYSRVMML